MLGYETAAEVLNLDMAQDVYADAAERQRLVERDTYSDRQYDNVEATWKRRDGRLLTVQLSVRAVRNAAGRGGLANNSTVDIFGFYVPLRHGFGVQKIESLKGGGEG